MRYSEPIAAHTPTAADTFLGLSVRPDKSGSQRHAKSLYRDARFVLEPLSFKASAEVAATSAPSVTTSIHPLHPHLPKFWRRYRTLADSLPLRHFKTPASWRELSDPLRLLYLGRALRDLEDSYSFTLDLGPKVEALARSQTTTSPLTWLRDRIADHLKDKLQRPVNVIVVLEETDNYSATFNPYPRLHVHGAVGITPDEEGRAGLALRAAGGKWKPKAGAKGGELHQAHLNPRFDDGWMRYCAVDHAKHTDFVRHLRDEYGLSPTFASTFNGSWFAVSQPVTARATALYEADRATLAL